MRHRPPGPGRSNSRSNSGEFGTRGIGDVAAFLTPPRARLHRAYGLHSHRRQKGRETGTKACTCSWPGPAHSANPAGKPCCGAVAPRINFRCPCASQRERSRQSTQTLTTPCARATKKRASNCRSNRTVPQMNANRLACRIR